MSIEPYKTGDGTGVDDSDRSRVADMYDLYGKASTVHSKHSRMTEDYTLTNYHIDMYNEKLPKFIREQRKLLRIIKNYMIPSKEKLRELYNDEIKIEYIIKKITEQYLLIEELLLGELDEVVIMGRSPKGEVIGAFLKHGLNDDLRDGLNAEMKQSDMIERLKEKEKANP